MLRNKNKKIIGSISFYSLVSFIMSSILQAIVGWLGLNFFKYYYNKWFGRKNESNSNVFKEKQRE